MTEPPSAPSASPEELGFELPQPVRTSRLAVIVSLVMIVGGAFAFGYLQRSKSRALPETHGGSGPIRAEVMKPTVLSSDQALSLPGSVRPLEEAKIYSRSSGYVRRWLVDIGDKVTAGQLLAEIDTPELDAQLAQARAQLAQARATVKQAAAQRDFATSNSARFATLAEQKLVASAEAERTKSQAATEQANVAASESNVVAQEANVRRLLELQGFAKVTAPFAGTVTERTIDRGTLVGMGGGLGGNGGMTPMFTVVATDPIRIFVDVPQSVAPSVRSGTGATVSVREYPGRTFKGTVTRASGALDPELRVMTTEVQVPNTDGALLPGMYVQVAINLPVPHHVLEIPATALYSDAQGLRVATVDAQNHIRFVPITIERDTGATLWIATGLTGDERVLKIAVPSLVEGDTVEVVQAAPPSAGTGVAAGSASVQKSSP